MGPFYFPPRVTQAANRPPLAGEKVISDEAFAELERSISVSPFGVIPPAPVLALDMRWRCFGWSRVVPDDVQ